MIATTAFVLVEANSASAAPFRPAHARFQLFFSILRTPFRAGCQGFMDIIQHSIAVGKYLVSPLIRHQDDGNYAASVSIRSGQGSGMHDRVMRFTPRFASHAAAARYAIDQGLCWVRERSSPLGVAPLALSCAG
ncbi:hypothetical protein QFZ42_005162 [Variovorax paradoxus]|nr:hypothetical protein [Variovorax paradoxus]